MPGVAPIQHDAFPLPARSAETHLDFMREADLIRRSVNPRAPHP